MTIKTIKLPNMNKPCKDCPFKKDCLEGWLGSDRMKEILSSRSFVCHKKKALQCAGHMILKGEENEFYQMAKLMGIDLGLSGRESIFDSKEECIAHHI